MTTNAVCSRSEHSSMEKISTNGVVEYIASPPDSLQAEKGGDEFALTIDPIKEKALVRKIDLHVIPLAMVRPSYRPLIYVPLD
jgi:hypothetical protein